MDTISKTVEMPAVNEELASQDMSALEMAKMNRKLALAQAEKALAQNELAELSFRYVALQLYMKYGLNPANDSIDENGKITRNNKVPNGIK